MLYEIIPNPFWPSSPTDKLVSHSSLHIEWDTHTHSEECFNNIFYFVWVSLIKSSLNYFNAIIYM